jgi:hypothetical protein
MMISTCSIDILDLASELTTRPVGAKARDRLVSLLAEHETIEIDFHNKTLTPSFADECIGRLAARLGLSDFRERVKLVNLSSSSRPLVRHVILTRCNTPQHNA